LNSASRRNDDSASRLLVVSPRLDGLKSTLSSHVGVVWNLERKKRFFGSGLAGNDWPVAWHNKLNAVHDIERYFVRS
jgi:hypothetical protein